MSKFYALEVIEVRKETLEATSLFFRIPRELQDVFTYKPGQYVTLRLAINGQEVRRSYSICSSPSRVEPLRIAVKRVKGGLVSNHINDHIKIGDRIELMPPEGRFIADVDQHNYKTYYLFCAGSGVTPILSILRTVLLTEEHSFVYMLYGNRNEESIMFAQELDALQETYGDRFILDYTLSRPKSKWSDLWSNNDRRVFRKGRVDSNAVKWFINEYPLYAQNAQYYICGPGTMIANTEKALLDIDVPKDRIFTESFGNEASTLSVAAHNDAKLRADLDGETVQVTVPNGKTILRTLIAAGKEPPYSCEGGVCASCICRLTKGEVHMKNNSALSDEEVAQGYILSCQSIPLSSEVAVVYD